MLTMCIFLHCRADDMQDNSFLRGGIPVAHSIYGFASTLSAINFAVSVPLDRVLKLNNPDAVKIYNEMVLEMTRGQAIIIRSFGRICGLHIGSCTIKIKAARCFQTSEPLIKLILDLTTLFQGSSLCCVQLCDDV